MFSNIVTRYPNGVTNARETSILSDISIEDRIGRFHSYEQDFDQYIATDYTLTLNGGAVAAIAGDGGLITLTTAVSALTSLQKTPAAFVTAKNFIEIGSFVATVDNLLGLVFAGVLNVTATPFTGASQTDGIYFTTATTGVITANIAVGGVITSVVMPNTLLVAGSPASFTFYYDGALYPAAPNGRVIFDVSGAGVTASSRTEIIVPTASVFPGATVTTPTVAVSATTAAARTLTLDRVWVAKARQNPNASPVF